MKRKIRTDKHELRAFREVRTVEELNRVPDARNFVYNHIKPHQSLGCLTPREIFNAWMEERKYRDDVLAM